MEVQSVWGETPLWFIAALVTWKQFSLFLQIWKTSNFTSNFMNMFVLPPLICIRVRWFQLFVVDSFGELSKSTGYRDKHLDLNGYGVGGLLYPPRTLPMWQNSFQVCKNRFFGFPLLKSDRILAIFTQTSSVTKRNIMDRMDMALGMVYTPHQWTYSDRNDSYREKSTFSFLAANLSRTGQCFQHGKGVSLVPWYEDTKSFTPSPQKMDFWPKNGQIWPKTGILGQISAFLAHLI